MVGLLVCMEVEGRLHPRNRRRSGSSAIAAVTRVKLL